SSSDVRIDSVSLQAEDGIRDRSVTGVQTCALPISLEPGFEDTAAFDWLCQHAGDYGFILRYPTGEAAEAVTEITYEPWHWRYVGPENAARINASGLIFEQYIAELQSIAAAV